MNVFVLVAGGQLLKHVHIPKLNVIMRAGLVTQTHEEPVLIKGVVNNIAAEIDMHLIVHHH